jgi:hypothetical protein
MRFCAVAASVAALLLASSPASSGPGFWSSTGPHGGYVFDITGDPTDPSLLYAITASGVFRSVDGGDNWIEANDGFGFSGSVRTSLVVDADRPQDIYAFDGYIRMYRSSDRGVQWSPAGYQSSAAFYPLRLVDVPGSEGELLLLRSDKRPDGEAEVPLLRSTDFGASFVPFGNGLPEGGAIHALAFDPQDPTHQHVLLVRGEARHHSFDSPLPHPPTIYRSTDGGANWSPVYAPARLVSSVGITPGGGVAFGPGNIVYAATDHIVVRSDDRGLTWAGVPGGVVGSEVVVHPADGDIFWAHDGSTLRHSDDGGASVRVLSAGLTPNAGYTSTGNGAPIGVEMFRLWMPADFPGPGSRLWLATFGSGLFGSADQGASWAAAHDGLAAVNVRGIAVHPLPATASAVQGLRLYAGFGDPFYSSPAMYRTSGSAQLNWQVQNGNLRASQIRAIAIDPTTARPGDAFASSVVYAGGAGSYLAGYRNSGLYKSINGGGVWASIDAGLPMTVSGTDTYSDLGAVRTLALDPRSCPAEPRPPQPMCVDLAAPGEGGGPAIRPLQRVYAATDGTPSQAEPDLMRWTHRLIRSDDAGASWSALDTNPGFPPTQRLRIEQEGGSYFLSESVTPVPVVISPHDPDLIYVGTFASAGCTRVGGGACPPEVEALRPDPHSGVIKSTDRGATWTPVNNGLPRREGFGNTVVRVLSMVMHPSNDDMLWISAVDQQVPDPAPRPPSIYRTVDGGASWQPAANGIPAGTDIRALAIDPVDGNRLYAAGFGTRANPGSVFRSTDGGANWVSMSVGLPAASALALAVDPHNPDVLHAGTGGGLWSIEQVADADDDGIPDAIENFAPNGGDGNADGQPDSVQRQVGSVIIILNKAKPATVDDLADAAKSAASGGGFVTIEVIGGEGDCAQAVDVQSRLAARFGRDVLPGQQRFYRYPRDLVQFEILDCSAATVDITFHNAAFDSQHGWSMRFYGPAEPGQESTIGWHDISERAQQVGSNRWRLNLEANAFGSYRPDDDRILFIGGPACNDVRVFWQGGFEAVPTGLPGCS